MGWKSKVFSPGPSGLVTSAGLLVLRVASGAMIALGHGLPKLKNFGQWAEQFPDPLGMGTRLSFLSVLGAEFFCGLVLVLGLATRLMSLPLAFAMAVAAFVVHQSDPWFVAPGVDGAKELALLYLIPFVTLLITGPGRYSLDALIAGKGS
ncbi:MAG TPA: DoxX family protein [Verrucomicrobiales bacterium]|nr:DoxX family protein [Verrucomicrobiales bacterium]